MKGNIYKITNDINEKVYVGKTLHPIEKRFQEHLRDSQREGFDRRPLYKAIRKYGQEHFKCDLIEQVEISDLSDRETYWIKFFNSYSNGYNATLGGDGKILYNYDDLLDDFLSGSLVKEVAEHFGCDLGTVEKVLDLANINHFQNAHERCSKKLRCFKNNEEHFFSSRSEAAQWLMDNGLAKAADKNSVAAAIGRAANGLRKTAYKYEWENL